MKVQQDLRPVHPGPMWVEIMGDGRREHSDKRCCCGGHNDSNPKSNRHHHSTAMRLHVRRARSMRETR